MKPGNPRRTLGGELVTVRSPRRRAREFALQGLYQWQLSGNDEAAIESHLGDVDEFDKADREFFVKLLRGVLVQRKELQGQLQAYLDRPFGELSPIEACILLAGAFELRNYPQTPYRVIINESIELAKAYGGTDGHKYVNGVLDKLAASLRPAEVEAKRAARAKAR
ncbi:MAG TPA: transcription antitermination factor NusB [Accumulibacter sp.]|uniref:transcription antitermination factor NusB n=1 Tax=Accumulibacter sp. TaxID=2053492 RepID=UPI0026153ADE|nr:transcription antitermination factor NusB [Accumulibacter sp.]HRD94363.1 transcription antitermination factor NusB [Accumulibacter sp.]HRF71433.1 transcription antitermination factor NusB [Accumulibacter sp.]